MTAGFFIVDTHSDFITKHYRYELTNSKKRNYHWTVSGAKRGGIGLQVMGIYTSGIPAENDTLFQTLNVIDFFYHFCSQNKELQHCLTYDDICSARRKKKIAIILAIENAALLKGNVRVLRILHKLGIRMLSLTWNYRNELADGLYENDAGSRLTTAGVAVVREIAKLGIVLDVSHLNESGFWHIVEIYNKPFIASHSNARTVCDSFRNLTDEQIKAVSAHNGVIGVTFVREFLARRGASLNDVIRHIEHICELVGDECVGIGSDFDGIQDTPAGIRGAEDMYKIANELLKRGYSETSVKKIAGENFLRVFRTILKTDNKGTVSP